MRLASLLHIVPEDERPGVYRRLGDLALFLTGVFPDHTEMRGLGPHDEGGACCASAGSATERPLTSQRHRNCRAARTTRGAVGAS